MANIELDGANKKIKVDSGDLTLDVPGDIILDADGGDVVVADGGTNILKVTNSSSDVVLQPQVDAKDIIFKQYDGTTVATVEDNGTFNIPANKLAIGGTAVTSTAAELNILDGVTSTAAELNIVDGNTSATSTTLADADRVVVNDAGTMKQVAMTDVKTYMGSGNLVLISNYNVSSGVATITFDNVFTTTYKNYLIITSNVEVSQTAKTTFNFRSGGSTLTGNYQQAMSGFRSGNSVIEFGNANQTDFTTTIANDIYQDSTYSERMYIYDPKNSADKRISQLGAFKDSNQHHATYHGTGVYTNSTTSIDGFILERTSGHFTTRGQITVYGIKNA